jgi:RPA family protein
LEKRERVGEMGDTVSSAGSFVGSSISTPQKRNVAFKMRIGNILEGSAVIEDERFRHLDFNGSKIVRVNVIANVIDRFVQEGEKKFGSLTLDDGSGQVKVKLFGDDVEKMKDMNQGDTILVVGLLRSWNNEIYISPEIMRKREPDYLLIRKLEVERDMPKPMDKEKIAELKDKVLRMVKDAEKEGGVDIDKLIMEIKESPDAINKEIKRLLEEGVAYEPRPGKLRYLG